MTICLKVLKMTIEKNLAEDKKTRSVWKRRITLHLKGCETCRNFTETVLGVGEKCVHIVD